MFLRRAFSADEEMIVHHLLSLSESDRAFRFGGTAKESAIRHYVTQIQFMYDGVFIFTDNRTVVGCVHVSLGDEDCEISVSVSSDHRGKGYASRLIEAGLLFARNRFRSVAKSHCMPSNLAMRKIAERIMEKTQHDEGELVATITIPHPNALSYVQEMSLVVSSLNQTAQHAMISFLPQFPNQRSAI